MSTNSAWGIYVEPDQNVRRYYCRSCKSFTGLMHRRTCKDADGNIHKEYKIVCDHCSSASQIHWSKNLTEHCWKAVNPNLNEDYISTDVADMLKKG